MNNNRFPGMYPEEPVGEFQGMSLYRQLTKLSRREQLYLAELALAFCEESQQRHVLHGEAICDRVRCGDGWAEIGLMVGIKPKIAKQSFFQWVQRGYCRSFSIRAKLGLKCRFSMIPIKLVYLLHDRKERAVDVQERGVRYFRRF